MYFSLSVLSALLISSGVSGFAPLAPPRLVTSHLAASIVPPTPSTEPKVFFQRRIAEPKDVGSVPAAALLLTEKFPDKSFEVHYRSNSNYVTGRKEEKGPVLDLSVLKKIKIDDDGDSIKVDPGASVSQLANELQGLTDPSLFNLKELFLALPADGELSVVEAALDEKYHRLRGVIEEVHIVDKNGNISSKQLSDINEEEDIIVNVVLSAPKGLDESKDVRARWYNRKPEAAEVAKGFVANLPEDIKVMVFKYGNFNPVPRVVVFVDGDKDIGLPADEWDEIVVDSPEQYWRLQNDLSIAARFDALTASATLDIDSSEIDVSFSDIKDVFLNRKEHLLVTIENGKIRASFDAMYPPDVDIATSKQFTFDDNGPKTIAYAARDKPLMRMIADKRKLADTNELPVVVEEGTTIPGFKGEIYDGVRGQMQDKRFQYATTSYNNMMNPAIIAYPLDAEDVAAAIKWATLDEFAEARKTKARPSGYPLKVMGRGGGHQYCGVSCDNGALILSMENLDRLDQYDVNIENVSGPDGNPTTVKKEVHVGTGHKLRQWADWANKHGFTIPHGECPTVGLGGHSQSGGYGHIVRNFGCAVDYIYGFTIVTADGEIRDVNRDSEDQRDKDLYWAVLGGSPGAFGVTTELVIHPILDEDWPNSTAFSTTCSHTPKRQIAVLKILEDFINRSKEDDEDALAEGLDLMISLSSKNDNNKILGLFQPSVMLFELECRDKTDEVAYSQMKEIIKRYKKEVKRFSLTDALVITQDEEKHYPLSELSMAFTRAPPSVTSTGRENKRAYKKAAFGSKDKLKPGWSDAFGELLNDVVATKDDISCVFQVVVGGGAQTRLGKANLNALSQRDVQLSSIVFDLFHGADDKDFKAADELQHRFELEVVNEYQTAYPHVMAQWASHGDLDMDKQEVWETYFDKPETYHRLRQIKRDWDPDDVFHSRFTVRPATD